MVETKSEKLLGITVSDELMCEGHLHGETSRVDTNESGLLLQLSQRVGMLRKLS